MRQELRRLVVSLVGRDNHPLDRLGSKARYRTWKQCKKKYCAHVLDRKKCLEIVRDINFPAVVILGFRKPLPGTR